MAEVEWEVSKAPEWVQSVDPAFIIEQRILGWRDIHPEDFCHRCGRRFSPWFSPDWHEVVDYTSDPGVLCPQCFIALRPDRHWVLSRYAQPGEESLQRLTSLLRHVSDLGDDAGRVAGCVLDAGYELTDYRLDRVTAENARLRGELDAVQPIIDAAQAVVDAATHGSFLAEAVAVADLRDALAALDEDQGDE